MSAFDAKVRVGHVEIALVRENEDELAQSAELILGVHTFVPVSQDQLLPEEMKEPSKIEIATDLGRAEQMAKVQENLG